MAKKNKKKTAKTSKKSSAKKAAKGQISKKSSKKAKVAAKPKPKPVVKSVKEKKGKPVKPEVKKNAPPKAIKKSITLPKPKVLPHVEDAKPKGSPTKLSMALEEKETKPAFVKPRITRSRSGNLLFQLEYTIRSSPAILYEFLTTSSGLAQWFADSVDINDHHCSFLWEGFEETATIIDSIPDEYIRYRWDNSDEDEYFEFRISKNEITSDTILTITDFASESAMKDQKMLWDSQVKTLTQQIGG